jgi:hypothetical protein
MGDDRRVEFPIEQRHGRGVVDQGHASLNSPDRNAHTDTQRGALAVLVFA